jgi:hypothetical protein
VSEELTSPDAGENLWKGHRRPILFGLAMMLALVVLFCSLIPEQHTTLGTRPLQYDSSMGAGVTAGTTSSQYSVFLTVTNKDLSDGNFSVTLNLWSKISQPYGLLSNSSETMFVGAGATEAFSAPSDWTSNGQYSVTRDYAFNDKYLINYSVIGPSVPYNDTQI